jgi:PAS domain S-box-containing protein
MDRDLSVPVVIPTTESQNSQSLEYVAKLLGVFGLYFAVGKLGLLVPFTSNNVSPIWPASGLALAAVLLWGYRMWPGIAAAAFAVNYASHIPWISATGIAVGNASSAILGGYLFHRLGGLQRHLPTLRDILNFLLVCVFSPVIAASLGSSSLYLAHMPAWSGFGTAWRVWWLGDAMGALIVTPLLFSEHNVGNSFSRSRLVELVLLGTGLFVTCSAIFGRHFVVPVHDDVLAFVVFPFVIWAAIRVRLRGVAITILLIAAIAVWATAEGKGPFAESNPMHNVTLLQLFIAVISVTGLMLAAVITERARTEESLLEKSELLDLANDAILIRALDDTITYWNRGAERLYVWRSAEVVGRPIHEVLRTEFGKPFAEIKAQLLHEGTWQGELTHFKRDGTRIYVASRWSVWSNRQGQTLGFLELNTDITERQRAEINLRALSGRLLRMQDEERRRIARELHDSAGQMLVALHLNLGLVQAEVAPHGGKAERACRESMEILEELTKELRTMSYLLHPPLLDEAGLPAAITWYVEGFSARSKILVDLELPSDLGRLCPESETAIFRVIQEALTNVHRHSGSLTASIRITHDVEAVHVEVQDKGKGIPKRGNLRTRRLGVGIQGMRERIRQLGGQFEIRSDKGGTLILVSLPISGPTAFCDE